MQAVVAAGGVGGLAVTIPPHVVVPSDRVAPTLWLYISYHLLSLLSRFLHTWSSLLVELVYYIFHNYIFNIICFIIVLYITSLLSHISAPAHWSCLDYSIIQLLSLDIIFHIIILSYCCPFHPLLWRRRFCALGHDHSLCSKRYILYIIPTGCPKKSTF